MRPTPLQQLHWSTEAFVLDVENEAKYGRVQMLFAEAFNSFLKYLESAKISEASVKDNRNAT